MEWTPIVVPLADKFRCCSKNTGHRPTLRVATLSIGLLALAVLTTDHRPRPSLEPISCR